MRKGAVGRIRAERAQLDLVYAALDARYGLAAKTEAEPEVARILAELVGRLQQACASLEAVRGKRILDVPSGSNTSRSPITRRRTAQFEPWMCRLLLELGAEPVAVDIGDLEGEPYEHHRIDLGAPGALDLFPDGSFDGLHESRLFGSPEFTEAYGPVEADRIRREMVRQERRLLRPGGVLIHSDIDPRLRREVESAI
jgi:hypothetical protein